MEASEGGAAGAGELAGVAVGVGAAGGALFAAWTRKTQTLAMRRMRVIIIR